MKGGKAMEEKKSNPQPEDSAPGKSSGEDDCYANIQCDKDEYHTLINALNQYGNQCLNTWNYTLQKGTRKLDGQPFTIKDSNKVKNRADMCFALQRRLQDSKA
jgi:hypothetical protein